MNTEPILLDLIGLFVALLVTAKVGGTIGFWLFSYILGNKLAALLEEDHHSERQEATNQADAPPWKVPPRRRHQSRQTRRT